MLVLLMIFCAAGGVFLIALGVYTELREVWMHPDHPIDTEHPRAFKPPNYHPPRRV